MPITVHLTAFQADELVKALKKRRQVLKAAMRRNGDESELLEKLIAVEAMLAGLKPENVCQ